MRTPRRLKLLPVLGMLIATSAFAQNASTLGSMELYPTFRAVGVRLVYTGDVNVNATARLEWRSQGSTTWLAGVDMTRITNNRWAGSVFWLQADTPYDVRATITDADGGGTVTGTIRTRKNLPSAPSGRAWWVATNGNDTNAGTSTTPLATLQGAASRAVAGDEIRVRPGIYYQTLDTPVSGTAAAPIHLTADGPGVVFDGSDPAYLNRSDWRSDGSGVYSVPYTPTTNRLVCADSVQRLYQQASVAALQTNGNGVAQGFVITGGRLYVKLESGTTPVGHVMHVTRYNVGLLIDQSYWHVSGLEVRYFGNTTNGSGIQLATGSGSWITRNYVHTVGHRGIFIRLSSSQNLVENNIVRDARVGTWPWAATKSHDEEITGISNRGGRGNVIRSNTVKGMFDGLDANSGDTDENIAADADYYENLVTGCGDDAIETDTVSGINLRLWSNTFDGNYGGISMAPIYQGPEYVMYNTITNYQRGAFKESLSGTGHAWIYHNTATSNVAGKPAVWPGGPYSNLHFRNNILVGNGIGAVNDDSGESQTGNDFNGDLIHSTSSTLFRWKNTNYATLATLRSGTGFEMNGRSGSPLFVLASSGNYNLQAGSPAINGALRIPGINDTYSGSAPDMGAREYVSSVGVEPRLAAQNMRLGAQDIRLGAPWPNPSRDITALTFAIPKEAPVAVHIYDVTGRMVRQLADEVFMAGPHTVEWDGRDAQGLPVSGGFYLARLETLGEARTTRVLRLR